MNSEQLFERSCQYVPGGVHSPVRSFKGLHTTPRFINSAKGAYLTDEEGKDYIDFCMSFGPLILGHQDPLVKKEVIQALDRGWSYGASEKYSLDLAELIVDNIPFIDQIRFVNSGTEAVMTAIRLARGATKRSKILKFNGCYHGHTDAMLIKAGSGLAGTTEASSQGVPSETANDTLVCELGNIEEVQAYFERYPEDIAGIFIEPLPANNGLLVQDKNFLQQLRDITKQYGSLLIFDEVISGFRTGFQGMSGDLGVTPDMVTYGKIIGGGFPVGAIASTKEIMEHLAPLGGVYQAGTLSANPVAMIAGYFTIKQLLEKDFYLKLEAYSQSIYNTFNEWFAPNGYKDYTLKSYKSLFWPTPTHEEISNITQMPTNLTDRFYGLFKELLEKGIYLSPNAYEIGFNSIAHTSEVNEELKRRLWS